MFLLTRFSCAIGYLVFAILVVMTTAAYLEKLEKEDQSMSDNLISQPMSNVPVSKPGKFEKYEHLQKRQSFSVTQDLDALAQMLREASMRRRLQNAIAFFNALKKRDVESTYGRQRLDQILSEIHK